MLPSAFCPRSRRAWRVIVALTLLFPLLLSGRREEWTDLDGNTFKGEPAGIIGPLALFSTGSSSGRHVLLSKLSPADCVRFHQAWQALPPRASAWAEARARVTDDCPGRVGHLRDGEFVALDLGEVPEPKLLLVFFASHSAGRSWSLMGDATDAYHALRREFPGELEGLYVGMRHNGGEHLKLARDMNLPWLVADYAKQRGLSTIELFAPPQAPAVALLHRHGVPIMVDAGKETKDVHRVLEAARAFLEADQPDNPRTWPHLRYFFHHARLGIHLREAVPPRAVGSPLNASALEQFGVSAFRATLEVGADGVVTEAKVEPGPGIPGELVPDVEKALLMTPVVPAIDRGKAVAGTLEIRYPGA
jgi:hypothetical protein